MIVLLLQLPLHRGGLLAAVVVGEGGQAAEGEGGRVVVAAVAGVGAEHGRVGRVRGVEAAGGVHREGEGLAAHYAGAGGLCLEVGCWGWGLGMLGR